MVVQRRRIGIALDARLMNNPVNFVGGDARAKMRRGEIHDLLGQFTDFAHLDDIFCGKNFNLRAATDRLFAARNAYFIGDEYASFVDQSAQLPSPA